MNADSSLEATLDPSLAQAMPRRSLRQRLVIDAPTRMFHWLFALSFAGAYATAESEHWRLAHVSLGYTMAGLLAFRLLYGLFGPRQAGLGVLIRKLASAPAWLKSVSSGLSLAAVNWRQGQNLLMTLAVLLLLAMVVPLVLSGYATYNDWGASMGGDWLEEVHEFFGQGMLMLVLAHLGLIAGISLMRGRNQALPMLTGRSEGQGPDPVRRNHAWLAVLLLAGVLAFFAWQWQQAPAGGTAADVPSGHAARRDHRGHD